MHFDVTRRDTQEVWSCELVIYGIPLITSDLPVCREIFGNRNTVEREENIIKMEYEKYCIETLS